MPGMYTTLKRTKYLYDRKIPIIVLGGSDIGEPLTRIFSEVNNSN